MESKERWYVLETVKANYVVSGPFNYTKALETAETRAKEFAAANNVDGAKSVKVLKLSFQAAVEVTSGGKGKAAKVEFVELERVKRPQRSKKSEEEDGE